MREGRLVKGHKVKRRMVKGPMMNRYCVDGHTVSMQFLWHFTLSSTMYTVGTICICTLMMNSCELNLVKRINVICEVEQKRAEGQI